MCPALGRMCSQTVPQPESPGMLVTSSALGRGDQWSSWELHTCSESLGLGLGVQGCVTLGRAFPLSRPQFPHLPCLPVWLRALGERS